MNGWTLAAFLVGWILGTWMSWRKILQERRRARSTQAAITTRLTENLGDFLKDIDVIKITVTEDGEKELELDQDRLDVLLGNKTKH